MPANPSLSALDQGHDGYLHHRSIAEVTTIQRQLVRMDMVLGIVEDDGRKAHAFGALVLAQRRPQPVELVALRRRALAAADLPPPPPVARNQRRHDRNSAVWGKRGSGRVDFVG